MRRAMVLGLGLGLVSGGLVGGPGARAQEPTTTTPTTSTGAVGAEATVAEVAGAIVERGWYAHPGAVGDREQLQLVAERLALQGDPMGFALLDAEPAGGSTAYAEDVLDELVDRGDRRYRTVVVLSDADVGVVSDVWSDAAIDAALDETIDDLRADPTDGLEALADALADEPTGFDDGFDDGDDGGSGGGGSSIGWIVFAVILIGGLVVFGRLVPTTEGYDDGTDSSYRRRRRMSSFRSSPRRSGGSSRSSSSSSRRSSSRGRGGRRL